MKLSELGLSLQIELKGASWLSLRGSEPWRAWLPAVSILLEPQSTAGGALGTKVVFSGAQFVTWRMQEHASKGRKCV